MHTNKIRSFVVFGALMTAVSTNLYAVDGRISYDFFKRLNKPNTTIESDNWIGLSLKSNAKYMKERKGWDSFRYDFDGRFYTKGGVGGSYSLAEGYLTYKNNAHTYFMGRKKLDWQPNESYWSLGNLNGWQAMDLLSTKQEGLTGITYQYKGKGLRLQVFGSLLYLPTLNPGLEAKDGKITSRTEWTRLPPTKGAINGVETPIHYNINKPKISNIVFQKSLGAQATYTTKNKKTTISAYGIYKPENKVRVNSEAFYDLKKSHIRVNSSAAVNHHVMYGANVRRKLGQVDWNTGVDFINPNVQDSKEFETEFFKIKPSYEKEAYLHTRFDLKRRSYDVTLNYIHLLTKNERKGDDFLSDAVKWKRTVGLGYTYYFSDYAKILFDFKYDIERKDAILKGELATRIYKSVDWRLGLETIQAPLDKSYWSYFRTNDTVYSSLGYQF